MIFLGNPIFISGDCSSIEVIFSSIVFVQGLRSVCCSSMNDWYSRQGVMYELLLLLVMAFPSTMSTNTSLVTLQQHGCPENDFSSCKFTFL
jgi:hypothetical protein